MKNERSANSLLAAKGSQHLAAPVALREGVENVMLNAVKHLGFVQLRPFTYVQGDSARAAFSFFDTLRSVLLEFLSLCGYNGASFSAQDKTWREQHAGKGESEVRR